MTKSRWSHVSTLAKSVLLSLSVLFFCSCQVPKPPEPTPTPTLPVTDLNVGLNEAETVAWRFTTEGSDLLPVNLLRALIDINSGQPFSESLVNYGFLPSPAGPGNPYGLPVGWTTHVPDYSPLKLDYASVNCSACHTGQIEYQGQALRIDGGSNMADIEAFALAAEASVFDMLKSPKKIFLFVARLLTMGAPPETEAGALAKSLTDSSQVSDGSRKFLLEHKEALENDRPEAKDAVALAMGEAFGRVLQRQKPGPLSEAVSVVAEGVQIAKQVDDEVTKITDILKKYERLLRNRIELGVRAIHAFKTSPVAGPGRDDPWGIIRNLVFFTEYELTAPTSIPHLFHARQFVWYHADGNTNSVMQRNVAQAVALGAYVDPETDESTLKPRFIWALEDLMGQLQAPAWPEDVFGVIDREKAASGKAHFESLCAECHHAFDGTLFEVEDVGTDPNRAENFLRPQGDLPFWQALSQKASEIEAFTFHKAGITPEEAKAHEYVDPPVWRATGQYIARRLDGVWSTAPYLHNGSVPTLHDLLLPVSERPVTFPLGQREYDPIKVGYTTDVTDPIFVFDTSINSNFNTGHEYGTNLSAEQRAELIEYLKTL